MEAWFDGLPRVTKSVPSTRRSPSLHLRTPQARPTTSDPSNCFENRPPKSEKKYYLLSLLSESERYESK